MIILIAKIVLTALFGLAGTMKATRSIEQLAGAGMKWVKEYPENSVRLIGILQLLGALGVILPTLTGFLPITTLISAACLGMMMFFAALHHYKHQEYKNIGINVVLFSLCVFVVYNSL